MVDNVDNFAEGMSLVCNVDVGAFNWVIHYAKLNKLIFFHACSDFIISFRGATEQTILSA